MHRCSSSELRDGGRTGTTPETRGEDEWKRRKTEGNLGTRTSHDSVALMTDVITQTT